MTIHSRDQKRHFVLICFILFALEIFVAVNVQSGGLVGSCTESDLNAALAGGGTVTFGCSGTITLTGPKTISANTMIDGSGQTVTISGGGTVQLFRVNPGVTLTVSSLNFINGRNTNGGAIFNNGTFNASFCVFSNNVAQGVNGTNGAAGNDSAGGDGGTGKNGQAGSAALGGAVYNLSTASLSYCSFYTNSALGGTGGNGGRGGSGGGTLSFGGNGGIGGDGGVADGGAIYSTSSASVTNCTLYDNTAAGGSGGTGGAGGTGHTAGHAGNGGTGGVGQGGSVYASSGSTIQASTFYFNAAEGGNGQNGGSNGNGSGNAGRNGGNALGGALLNVGSSLVLCSTFYENFCFGGDAGNGGPAMGDLGTGGNGGNGGLGAGAGIYNASGVTVLSCTTSTNGVFGGARGLGGPGGPACSGGCLGSDGSAGAAQGANIASGAGLFTLQDSILNKPYAGANAFGTITDNGHNICSDRSITVLGSGTLTNTDAKIGPLANNGGPTLTCAFLSGTPAINAGDASATRQDQRGLYRTYSPDIGAYENNAQTLGYLFVNIQTTDDYGAEAGTNNGGFVISRVGATNLPVTVALDISGTAQAGTDYTALPANVTLAAGVVSSNLTVTVLKNAPIEPPETVVVGIKTGLNYLPGLYTNAVVTIGGDGPYVRAAYPAAARYERGTGTNPDNYTLIVPLDGLRGTARTNIETNSILSTVYQYNGAVGGTQSTTNNRIACNTPVASFGSGWGTVLYPGTSYSLGVHPAAREYDPMYILVFAKTNLAFIDAVPIDLPDTTDWENFSTNGFARTTNAYGLTTTVRLGADTTWGTSGGYAITHTASDEALDYYYVVIAEGEFNSQNAWIDETNALDFGYLYDLSFEPHPGWRSTFLDQPQFQGSPLPPDLLNKTPAELLNYGLPVTNSVSLSPSACTNIDQSPELRRHPVLDQFVSDMNNDPLALASYVQNEIDLTDPIGYRQDGGGTNESVNLGGVNRNALAVYQEGQGNPMEQCALLIYLLRQAGYPAAYVFPPDGGLKILDTRLSSLLGFRINGAQDQEQGNLYTTNQLISVNYPWVATYISNQWVHLFPWLKDMQVTEGLNLYDYLPDKYKQLQVWAGDYVLGDSNLMSFASVDDDTPSKVFPAWLNSTLETNAPGISLDDIGITSINRRHSYASFSDFPRPTWVTNTSTAVESLGSTSITNVSPLLTNVFDTVYVELFSLINPSKSIKTLEMRMADLHNRKFYLRHTNTVGTQCQAILTLASFRPGFTNQGTFATSDTTLTNKQVATLTLDGSDDQLRLRIRYRRQKALTWQTAIDVPAGFLEVQSAREVLQERHLRKGDSAAICLNTGRVTPAMLRVHAQELWNMEQQLGTNAPTSSISPDVYQGSLLYLVGMSYYNRVERFDDLNRRLNKIQKLSRVAMGLAKLSPYRNADGTLPSGTIDPVWPNVDMFFLDETFVNNDTARPDSGWDLSIPRRNYANLAIVDGSAQEHAILNTFFGQSNSVSTVKLLQLAQAKVPTGGAPIVELNYDNYVSAGNTVYNGIALKNHDPDIWADVANTFASPSDGLVTVAWMPPGTQTTPSGSFSGMAALIINDSQQSAVIGNNQYGAFGDQFAQGTFAQSNTGAMRVHEDAQGDFHFTTAAAPGQNQPGPESATYFDMLQTGTGYADGAYAPNLQQYQLGYLTGLLLNGSAGDYSYGFQSMLDLGLVGTKTDDREGNGIWQPIADPVNALTGEFYVDTADLSLPGPMPLQLRRNYGSQNYAANQLGYGWKLNYMPYLALSPSNDVVYAAEPDGSVFAFAPVTTNTWAPSLALNPTMNNDSANGIGSVANHLNARITEINVSGTNTWCLTNGNGSLRVFVEMSFPLTNSASFDRLRPYLTYWYDNQSNYYRFEYGTNSTAADYGQVRRIVSSSGNILRLEYDAYSRVVNVYSADGRRVQYDYDDHGDLTTVTLPDASQISYEYQHVGWNSGGLDSVYSTHLLVTENNPDGRTLKNEYDDKRRVTNQWSTVGQDLELVRNASFRYTNNFSLTALTNTLTGTTTILDYTNNATTYFYTNGLIRKIADPVGGTVVQDWYEANETNAPAYPRSLKTVTDKRGLVTSYLYDSQGNPTNITITGDLRGDGDTNATAVSTALFDANNLPSQRVNASGITNLYFYTNNWLVTRLEIWPSNAAPTQAITNLYSYVTVTNAGDGTFATGLRSQEIRAAGSSNAATNEWSYNSRGFPIQVARYTGDSDPVVVVTNAFNTRGELIQQTDAAGRGVHSGFDPNGKLQSREVFDAGQTVPMSWDYFYYNENGELTWSDGPRYNPEDYVWRDYDGAGRKIQEIHWRSEANTSGTGVQAPADELLYACSFFQYDPFGNLTKATDPSGNYNLRFYDAIGRLLRTEYYDFSGTLLSTNGQQYNSAGDVTNRFNPLGGSSQTLYTSTGKPKFQSNFDGSTNGWLYYADGRVRREIQRNGAYWQTTYDDANRKTTRTFYSASGAPLATNSSILDRRGNVTVRTDEAFNSFTNIYDGLDRVKMSAGPKIATPYLNIDLTTYTTSIVQQVTTYIYTNSSKLLTVSNAVGERTVTTSDPLGRPLTVQIFPTNSSTPTRVTSYAYSQDHHSVTVTNGSGTNAIAHTTYTDNDGRELLSIGYPSSNVREFTSKLYDLGGDLIYSERDSASNNVVSAWSFEAFYYDGLHRPIAKLDRDYAETDFYYDPAGNVTRRVMPGGTLEWDAIYNNAGQLLQEWNIGVSGAGTDTNRYGYFASTSPLAGLLQAKTNAAGLPCTYGYNDWLVMTTNSQATDGWQKLNTASPRDARGLVTGIIEWYDGNFPITIAYQHDAYGHKTSESVEYPAEISWRAEQSWDSAGRREILSVADGEFDFGWQADGSLTSVSVNGANAFFSYNDAGMLNSRIAGNRVTSTSSRDGMGRPLSIGTTVNTVSKLSETLTYTGDGLISGHSLAREDFTDQRGYSYATLSRRLASETLNVDGSHRWTNNFMFDGGNAAGLGTLSEVAFGSSLSSTSSWSSSLDAFSRPATETNSVARFTASGRYNGSAAVSILLDGEPIPSTTTENADAQWPWQWAAMVEALPGAHQLTASAAHPSGMFTTNVSIWVTNSAAHQTTVDSYDALGQVTQRVWKAESGAVARTQVLTWDPKGRLTTVMDTDPGMNGWYWLAKYDPLDRPIEIWVVPMLSGNFGDIQVKWNYFDPEIHWLQIGDSDWAGDGTWRLYGPDLDGRYGGLHGVGGLEAVVPPVGALVPVLADARGNILGSVSNGVVNWNPSRPTAYGAVPGYRPPSLWYGGDIPQSYAWRGKPSEIVGYVRIGQRIYDPESGTWLSKDPAWNGRDPNYYTFCGGDPINYVDANGMFGIQVVRSGNAQLGAFEDSFIGGGVGLMQMGLYGLGKLTGANEFMVEGDTLEPWKSPMRNLGIYNSGSQDAQIGQTAAVVTGAYGAARQIPSLTATIAGWWEALSSFAREDSVSLPPNGPKLVWDDPAPILQQLGDKQIADTSGTYTLADVQAAISRLEARGIQSTEVQSSIDPAQVIRLAQAMDSGAFQNVLMDRPVILDSTTQAIMAGHHRIIAAEMTDFDLTVNSIPASASSPVPLSQVPLQTGRVNPPIRGQ